MNFLSHIALETWAALVFFVVITLLHAMSLKRIIPWSFRIHLIVMGLLWSFWNVIVIYLALILPQDISFPVSIRTLGAIIALGGVVILVWHRNILGRKRFMGGRFFEASHDTWTEGGLFRSLKNPAYDAFIAIFVGLFFWRGNTDFLVLAVITFFVFNIFLARSENKR